MNRYQYWIKYTNRDGKTGNSNVVAKTQDQALLRIRPYVLPGTIPTILKYEIPQQGR